MIAVLLDELRRRRLFFVAALLCGLLPVAIPWLPLRSTADPLLPGLAAVALALVFGLAAAWSSGLRLLSQDLADGHLRFYLSRPLSIVAFWAGRWAAGAALIAGSMAAVVLPTVLVPGAAGLRGLRSAIPDGLPLGPHYRWVTTDAFSSLLAQNFVLRGETVLSPWLFLACALAVALAAGHFCGMAFRLRDPWTLLDLATVAVTAAILASLGHGLRSVGAWPALQRAGVATCLTLLVATAVIGWIQLQRAGAWAPRSHRIFSQVTAATLVVFSLALFGFAARSLDPTPAAVERALVVYPAGPDWAVLVGEVGRSGSNAVFAVEVRGDRFRHLGTDRTVPYLPVPDAAGGRLAWLECAEDGLCDLHALTLRQAATAPSTRLRLSVRLGGRPGALPLLAWDDGGRYLAVATESAVQVADLEQQRWVQTLQVDAPAAWIGVTTAGVGRWAVWTLRDGAPEGPRSRLLDQATGWIEGPPSGPPAPDQPPATVPARTASFQWGIYGPGKVFDQERGTHAWTIPVPPRQPVFDFLPLADGEVAALRRLRGADGTDRMRLELWRDGALRASRELEAFDGRLGHREADGAFWVGLGRGGVDVGAAAGCSPMGRPPGGATAVAALRIDPDDLAVLAEVAGVVPSRWRPTPAAGWLHGCDGWPEVLVDGALRPAFVR